VCFLGPYAAAGIENRARRISGMAETAGLAETAKMPNHTVESSIAKAW